MSRRGVIEREPAQTCELCGAIAETRPYGPDGTEVCHPCAMKDESNARKWCGYHLFGEPHPITGERDRHA